MPSLRPSSAGPASRGPAEASGCRRVISLSARGMVWPRPGRSFGLMHRLPSIHHLLPKTLSNGQPGKCREGGGRYRGINQGYSVNFPGASIHKETPIHQKSVPVADKSGTPRGENSTDHLSSETTRCMLTVGQESKREFWSGIHGWRQPRDRWAVACFLFGGPAAWRANARCQPRREVAL